MTTRRIAELWYECDDQRHWRWQGDEAWRLGHCLRTCLLSSLRPVLLIWDHFLYAEICATIRVSYTECGSSKIPKVAKSCCCCCCPCPGETKDGGGLSSVFCSCLTWPWPWLDLTLLSIDVCLCLCLCVRCFAWACRLFFFFLLFLFFFLLFLFFFPKTF